jgi:hypothetical protein
MEGGMNLTEITSTLAASPTLAAIALAAIVLFFGFRFLSTLDNESPFGPYAIRINLFPHKSVLLDNITLAPVLNGKLSKPVAEKTAIDLLEMVGLAEKASS